jgi:hypothetical protein
MTRTIACAGQQQAWSARSGISAGTLATSPRECSSAASFPAGGYRELVFTVPAWPGEGLDGKRRIAHPQGPKVPYIRPGCRSPLTGLVTFASIGNMGMVIIWRVHRGGYACAAAHHLPQAGRES